MMSVVMRRCAVRLNKQIRSFGSAAAAEVDYDYDDYYYHQDQNNASSEVGGRGVQWVIMGDPTIKRHVYADRLSKILDVPHISMATLLRQELNPNSPLYKKIASAVNQGQLVPDDVIFSLLSKRLHETAQSGFILDGIPRTTFQAEILDQIADIDLVLNLKSTLTTGIYSASRQFHSMVESDTIIKDKLPIFEQQKKPLEEYYKRQNKLFDFQVAGAPGDTWEGLLAALHLPNTNAVTSATNFSQKLTV